MSSTYRQSSSVSPESLSVDPENELLLAARDFVWMRKLSVTCTAMSGLLVENFGGKRATYAAGGIWESVAFVGSTTQNYKRDDGYALYRRSLYTFWNTHGTATVTHGLRRTVLAKPASPCCARTNTPLQALVLMNDTQYVEASRQLASRMLCEGGDSVEKQLAFGFESYWLNTSRS